ncbi:MAG: YbgA family protein [Desulfamplus sp.]
MTYEPIEPIKIGISTCLLGKNVRYDGGHSHDPFLTGTLGQFLEYVPVCPEVECGMPVPREAIRLVGDVDNPKLMTQKTGVDKTSMMQDWIEKKLKTLEDEELCGFIFKNKSPSSGLYRIKVYGEDGQVKSNNGVGLFARAFTRHFPRIPVEESGRLHDPKLRENFIENIFTLKRWRDVIKGFRQKTASNESSFNENSDNGSLSQGSLKMAALVDFHTKNKLLLLSHSEKIYRQMGRLVADCKNIERDILLDQYEALLLQALALLTTTKKNINVLLHMMGYFKQQLEAREKAELLDNIEHYRAGYVPLIVPITLIKHYVLKYDEKYLSRQTYLNPHPVELKLRNYY